MPAAIALTIPTNRHGRVATESTAHLQTSLERVVDWVRSHDYRGYEPADGNSSIFFALTGGHVLPMRALQQLVLRAPFNVRPFVGIRPHESAIGRGYMAWGYLLMARRTQALTLRREAVACLEWLMNNRSAGYGEFCWGDPYDYATRGGRRPLGEPLLIWSSLIGLAFLEAADVLGDTTYLGVANSIGRWILSLPAEHTDRGVCLSYVACRQTSIHNSNMMGAAFLARLGSVTNNPQALERARAAMEYSCSRQRDDGSWFYAEEPKYHWVDNFHTGYNLSALQVYQKATGDTSFERQLAIGSRYFVSAFFEPDGRPRYFDNSTYPIDIQCAAQSIETLASLSVIDPDCLPRAMAVAQWTVDHMQAADGHFCYRDLGWTTVSTPMLHWGQATMVKALAVLIDELTQQHV